MEVLLVSVLEWVMDILHMVTHLIITAPMDTVHITDTIILVMAIILMDMEDTVDITVTDTTHTDLMEEMAMGMDTGIIHIIIMETTLDITMETQILEVVGGIQQILLAITIEVQEELLLAVAWQQEEIYLELLNRVLFLQTEQLHQTER